MLLLPEKFFTANFLNCHIERVHLTIPEPKTNLKQMKNLPISLAKESQNLQTEKDPSLPKNQLKGRQRKQKFETREFNE